MKMRPGKILVFVGPEVTQLVTECLKGYELLMAHNFDQGNNLIDMDGVDLFVIDILFDESQAMELIKLIRAQPKHRKSSIVVTKLGPSDHAEMLRSVVTPLTSSQTISCYFEGEVADRDLGPVLRKTVDQYLPAHKRTSFNWVSYADWFVSVGR